jgi:hypothetical protein
MARPGRTETDSVSIWLKLSEEDAARLTQVLTRPEFAGWTRAEWCLEMIQTALGYYTRPRPPDAAPAEDPGAAANPGAAEAAGAVETARTVEVAGTIEAAEDPGTAEAVAEPGPEEPEAEPEPEAVSAAPVAPADEPEGPVDEIEGSGQGECPHPADARDYQSGTCAACGAILWD